MGICSIRICGEIYMINEDLQKGNIMCWYVQWGAAEKYMWIGYAQWGSAQEYMWICSMRICICVRCGDLGRRSTTSGFTRFLPTIDINFSWKQTNMSYSCINIEVFPVIKERFSFKITPVKKLQTDMIHCCNKRKFSSATISSFIEKPGSMYCLDSCPYLVKCPCFIVPVQFPRSLSHLVLYN